jgi:threonine dehydratase
MGEEERATAAPVVTDPDAPSAPATAREDRIVGQDRIDAARALIAGKVHRTPMLSSATAAGVVEARTRIRVADGRIYLKAEHLQKTGSYKPRGMVAKVATLNADERRRGIITISAGNAGQGYAYAGSAVGVPVTVVMPMGAVASKVDACRGYGAAVVLEGANIAETLLAMDRIRRERDLVFCHPYDDPDVISGMASVGNEIVEDLPDVDVVVVPVGGGGLIAGVAAAVKSARPSARVFGIEPEGSNSLYLALRAGEPVSILPRSIADGLNAPATGLWNLAMAQRYVDDVLLVTDETILAGMRFSLERTKQLLEPAGAAALAALLAGLIPLRDGDRVCAVLSGGNVDLGRLGELLSMAGPATARTTPR